MNWKKRRECLKWKRNRKTFNSTSERKVDFSPRTNQHGSKKLSPLSLCFLRFSPLILCFIFTKNSSNFHVHFNFSLVRLRSQDSRPKIEVYRRGARRRQKTIKKKQKTDADDIVESKKKIFQLKRKNGISEKNLDCVSQTIIISPTRKFHSLFRSLLSPPLVDTTKAPEEHSAHIWWRTWNKKSSPTHVHKPEEEESEKEAEKCQSRWKPPRICNSSLTRHRIDSEVRCGVTFALLFM